MANAAATALAKATGSEELWEERPASDAFDILKDLVAREAGLPPDKRSLKLEIRGNMIRVPTTPERILELYRNGDLIHRNATITTGRGRSVSPEALGIAQNKVRAHKSEVVAKLRAAIDSKDFAGITDAEVAFLDKYFGGRFAQGSRPKGGEIADYTSKYKSAISKLMKDRGIEPLSASKDAAEDKEFDAATIKVRKAGK